ncbi:hypothetical protein [Methylobacterium oryzae]|uniref:hypothetical protein n=1 Tax=Methylobacterium oryzae TaxID=334852 RepID=UPI002F3535A9
MRPADYRTVADAIAADIAAGVDRRVGAAGQGTRIGEAAQAAARRRRRGRLGTTAAGEPPQGVAAEQRQHES